MLFRSLKAAQAQLDALVRDQPTNPLTHYFVGSLAVAQKDWEKAADAFAKTILLNEGAKTELEQVYYELAEVHLNRDDAEAALKLLETVRKKFKATSSLSFTPPSRTAG